VKRSRYRAFVAPAGDTFINVIVVSIMFPQMVIGTAGSSVYRQNTPHKHCATRRTVLVHSAGNCDCSGKASEGTMNTSQC
jgi:hypothetical protein